MEHGEDDGMEDMETPIIDEEEEEEEEEFISDEEEEEDEEAGFLLDELQGGELKRTTSFDCLSEEQILSQSKKMIEDIKQVCALHTDAAAATMLRGYKWNKEKLIERYLEDADRTYKEAGITAGELEKPPEDPNKIGTCLICLEEHPMSETFALSCGHRYCKECWRGYLEVMIRDGPRSVYAKCPAPKCEATVHEEAYKNIVPEDMYKRYTKFLLRSFVEDNEEIKWCPSPGCTNALRCEMSQRRRPVNCKCGFKFCFRCSDAEIGDHSPVPCEALEKWLQKASDESENVKWMIANTKKCPQCRAPIEKNGGCMHMTCHMHNCKYEFCWMCRGPWSEHGSATGGYYQCNKYNESEAKEEDASAANVKTELETYMWYFHRYESHKNAGKIADTQRKVCTKREEEILNKFDVRSQDAKFLMEATEQLIENRRVLQYSYVMGYYLDKKKQAEKNLFEYLQEDLEKHTEHLSGLYEKEVSALQDYHQFMQWKEEVTNYTRVTSKFLINFLEGTTDGLTYQI